MKKCFCYHGIKPVCSLSAEYSESGTCHNICKPVTVVIADIGFRPDDEECSDAVDSIEITKIVVASVKYVGIFS